jgi:FMN-dependent NADH-azoreductase
MSVSEISDSSSLLSISYIDSVKQTSVSSIIERYREKYSDMKFIYSDWQKNTIKEMDKMNHKLDDAISRNKSENLKTLKLYESISINHNEFVSSMKYYENRPKKRKISEID